MLPCSDMWCVVCDSCNYLEVQSLNFQFSPKVVGQRKDRMEQSKRTFRILGVVVSPPLHCSASSAPLLRLHPSTLQFSAFAGDVRPQTTGALTLVILKRFGQRKKRSNTQTNPRFSAGQTIVIDVEG